VSHATPAPRRGIVVLGMHRSGTSAVTRVCNLLGAAVPAEEDLLVNYDNPEGHWESRTLVAANDRILGLFGRSWDFPPRLRPGWETSPRVQSLLPELADAFAAVYPKGPWVWKDPRTCLTFPLWRRVVGDDVCVVLVSRSAAAVTASIHRRDGIPRPYAAGLWHRYVASSLEAARGLPTLCLSFDQFLDDPVTATAKLADGLGSLGMMLPGDPVAAAASLRDAASRSAAAPADRVNRLVARLTARAQTVVAGLPERSAAFAAPPLTEPPWVRPLLFGYRGPWAVRSRLGHPLGPRFA